MITATSDSKTNNERGLLLNESESAVIKTLLYFNVFSHPLTFEELEKYSGRTASSSELRMTLEGLLKRNIIYRIGRNYSIVDDLSLMHRRHLDSERAEAMMPKARFFSKLISWFPFVRGVFISGSLSKGVIKETGDIDYFIVTSGNRLWICRSLLVLFKKIFLLNSHKYFCLNYFVDESDLLIREQNVFTAIEIESLIPMYNFGSYLHFKAANEWTKKFLPNGKEPVFFNDGHRIPFLKRMAESCFNNSAGKYLNDYFRRTTLNFWKKKYSGTKEINFRDNIKVKDTVAKYHPNKFQERVLQKLQEEMVIFEVTSGYKLS